MVWCRNQKIYNFRCFVCFIIYVVVWCRNQKIYNSRRSVKWSSRVVVWCRNQKIYNCNNIFFAAFSVVVWCRNQKIYNAVESLTLLVSLWFDVGIKKNPPPCLLRRPGTSVNVLACSDYGVDAIASYCLYFKSTPFQHNTIPTEAWFHTIITTTQSTVLNTIFAFLTAQNCELNAQEIFGAFRWQFWMVLLCGSYTECYAD